jgi:hypothetical protein
MISKYKLMYFFNYFKYIIMKNLFIFIYNNLDENVLDDNKYTNIIDYYKSHYEYFIVIIQNNNNNNIINNIIRKEKLSSYFELENNNNINLFILNNLNNIDCDNYIFLFGNLLEYNDNIISDLDKNKIFKTKFDINKFNLNSNVFSYNILDKNDIYEIKKKYMIL